MEWEAYATLLANTESEQLIQAVKKIVSENSINCKYFFSTSMERIHHIMLYQKALSHYMTNYRRQNKTGQLKWLLGETLEAAVLLLRLMSWLASGLFKVRSQTSARRQLHSFTLPFGESTILCYISCYPPHCIDLCLYLDELPTTTILLRL